MNVKSCGIIVDDSNDFLRQWLQNVWQVRHFFLSHKDAKRVSLVGPVWCAATEKEMPGARQPLHRVLIETTGVAQGKKNERLLHIDAQENMSPEQI